LTGDPEQQQRNIQSRPSHVKPFSTLHFNMSKSPGSLQFCPNPDCSSKVHKVFLSEANLNKHFGAKPACYEYAQQIFLLVVKESALVEEKMCSLGTDITTYPSAHQEIEQPLPTRLEDKDFGRCQFSNDRLH
jgi:hypothetical protein